MLLAVLKTAYPEFNKELVDDEHKNALRLWYKMLEGYTYKNCSEAVAQHIQKCKFAPKISEIIDIVKDIDDAYGFKKYGLGDEWQCRSWINLSENLGIPLMPWQVEIINKHPHLRSRLPETSQQPGLLKEAI